MKSIARSRQPCLEVREGPHGASGGSVSRHLFRPGRELVLQFNLHEKVTEQSVTTDRDRFFNSLKLEP